MNLSERQWPWLALRSDFERHNRAQADLELHRGVRLRPAALHAELFDFITYWMGLGHNGRIVQERAGGRQEETAVLERKSNQAVEKVGKDFPTCRDLWRWRRVLLLPRCTKAASRSPPA